MAHADPKTEHSFKHRCASCISKIYFPPPKKLFCKPSVWPPGFPATNLTRILKDPKKLSRNFGIPWTLPRKPKIWPPILLEFSRCGLRFSRVKQNFSGLLLKNLNFQKFREIISLEADKIRYKALFTQFYDFENFESCEKLSKISVRVYRHKWNIRF